MTERDFLNLVLECVGQVDFAEGWESGAQWEIYAQIKITTRLSIRYGVTEPREIKYPGSQESCDFGFALGGKTYGIEIKVESQDGRFAGLPLQQAMISDVGKLHEFPAENLWFLIIARSERRKNALINVFERGDSWHGGIRGEFVVGLCNIKTHPHDLPWWAFR